MYLVEACDVLEDFMIFDKQKNDETRWKYDGKGRLNRESCHLYHSRFVTTNKFISHGYVKNSCDEPYSMYQNVIQELI